MMTARDRAAFLLTVLLDRLDDRGDQVRVEDVLEIVDALVDATREPLDAQAPVAALDVEADQWLHRPRRLRGR